MKTEEGEVVVGPAVKGEPQVLHHVQGQPADDENQKHGKQDSASGSGKVNMNMLFSFFLFDFLFSV